MSPQGLTSLSPWASLVVLHATPRQALHALSCACSTLFRAQPSHQRHSEGQTQDTTAHRPHSLAQQPSLQTLMAWTWQPNQPVPPLLPGWHRVCHRAGSTQNFQEPGDPEANPSWLSQTSTWGGAKAGRALVLLQSPAGVLQLAGRGLHCCPCQPTQLRSDTQVPAADLPVPCRL